MFLAIGCSSVATGGGGGDINSGVRGKQREGGGAKNWRGGQQWEEVNSSNLMFENKIIVKCAPVKNKKWRTLQKAKRKTILKNTQANRSFSGYRGGSWGGRGTQQRGGGNSAVGMGAKVGVSATSRTVIHTISKSLQNSLR